MKVLWFEMKVPGRYKTGNPEGGWQDALEVVVRKSKEIDLWIAFEGTEGMTPKEVEGVHYIPLCPHFSLWETHYSNYANRWHHVNKVIPLAVDCINKVKPDLIQVFGSEWGFGQVARYTNIPVVLHMQGCVAPYLSALYPPSYSVFTHIISDGINIQSQWRNWRSRHYNESWLDMEQSNFKAVKYYMGRTEWDKQLVEMFHPGATYFHVEEALRPSFSLQTDTWKPKNNATLRLITTGCSNHWKGMDTLLRTAHVLKQHSVDFEWLVAGNMSASLHHEIEFKEKLYFNDNNVTILGYTSADKLQGLLLSSDIYVHTAYIDNSPNAICEAQYLGLPIISTNVGGIPSIVDDRKGGILLPANSCYNMAYEIISLSKDKKKQKFYSDNNVVKARERHNPSHILQQLTDTYHTILKGK